MKIKLLFAIAFLLSAFLIVGCSKDENPSDNNEDANYFPLTIGNSWTFLVYETDTAGTDTFVEVQSIVNDTIVADSSLWYVMHSTVEDSITDSSYYRKDTVYGYLYVRYFYSSVALDVIASKLNPQVNDDWEQYDTIMGIIYVHIYGKVEAREDITVPAGVFDCFKERLDIQISGAMRDTVVMNNWLSNNVGPVRIFQTSATDTTDMKLQAYSVH